VHVIGKEEVMTSLTVRMFAELDTGVPFGDLHEIIEVVAAGEVTA
jgi:hypothetical protein